MPDIFEHLLVRKLSVFSMTLGDSLKEEKVRLVILVNNDAILYLKVKAIVFKFILEKGKLVSFSLLEGVKKTKTVAYCYYPIKKMYVLFRSQFGTEKVQGQNEKEQTFKICYFTEQPRGFRNIKHKIKLDIWILSFSF